MLQGQGAELALAAIPSPAVVRDLSAELDDCPQESALWLAYTGAGESRLIGFLVTESRNLDDLLALCPVSADLVVGGSLWRFEVQRQWKLAKAILRDPCKGARADVVWLLGTGTDLRQVPVWLFSLSCVPVWANWDGQLLHPKPFCPTLFESMARQPAASRWIVEHSAAPDSG